MHDIDPQFTCKIRKIYIPENLFQDKNTFPFEDVSRSFISKMFLCSTRYLFHFKQKQNSDTEYYTIKGFQYLCT